MRDIIRVRNQEIFCCTANSVQRYQAFSLNNLTIYWDGYYKPFSDKIKELIEYENCVLIISGLNFTTITYILSNLEPLNLMQ